MMSAPPAPGASHHAPVTMAVRASDAWKSAEALLRVITGRPELAGQALLTEARRLDKLDMDGMHALVAMRDWVERTLTPGSAAQTLTLPPTDAEHEVAAAALAALERSVGRAVNTAIPMQPEASSKSQWAPQANDDGIARTTTPYVAPVVAPIAAPAPNLGAVLPERPPDSGRRSISSGMLMFIASLVVLTVGVGGFLNIRNRVRGGPASGSFTEEGVAAYTRGSREAARLSFVKAIEKNPDDGRALTYLGRISRELGSTATARQYLERAIRVDPNNSLASRELGSALLTDREFELARRFYVRALTIDPTDRIAQGFLGCALLKLNRTEEGVRWMERAGTGDWSSCRSENDGATPPAQD